MQHGVLSMPHAREEGLRVQQLPDEILVYDLERHRAHCLNKTAALVWHHCDGQTSITEATELLQQELKIPVTEELVWLALARLGQAHLLQERWSPPAVTPRASRREFVRRLGLAGGASLILPIVSSIVAPEAAHAVSCVQAAKCGSVPFLTPCHNGNPKQCTQKRCCGPQGHRQCVSVNSSLCSP